MTTQDENTLDVAVIVPTLNERHYLPQLLESIAAQRGRGPREIFIADGHSTDGTIELASRHAQVIDGGSHPGIGRNRGARQASSSWLLFLDADTILPLDFMERTLAELEERGLDAATTSLRCYDSRDPRDHLIWHANNVVQRVMQRSRFPVGSGNCLFVRRTMFERVGGFDESVRYAEDVDLVQRIVGCGGRWGVLESSKVWVTARRFARDGRFRMIRLFLGTGLHGVLHGPDRTNRYGVGFGHSSRPERARLAFRFLAAQRASQRGR